MTLATGTRFGSYELLGRLGAGGMGEVYRARDTNLGREVAVKILPAAVAADPDRIARFNREAKTLASLNHANVAAIYGVEEIGGDKALILELVEGPTLADRLAEGPIPLDEALGIAKQIAHALDAAHEAGIVHRDLKPANIKLRPDGTVKVLDFGLAKALAAGAASPDPQQISHSPTLTGAFGATGAGVLLGTAAYMSPEQARGKPVDRRADIWAFGCVLYEMLTGRQAFNAGESTSDAIAAILKSDPDWSALPTITPQPVRRLLRRCLQKDPRERLRDIADARLELSETAGETEVPSVRSRRPPLRAVGYGLAAFAAGAVVAGLVALATNRPIDDLSRVASIRFQIAAPPKATFGNSTPAISPDGSRLAFAAAQGGPQLLWIRSIDALDARPLIGTEGARDPFWSPDGRHIGFFADGKVKRIEASGGSAQALCEGGGQGATWSSKDVILFSEGTRGLFKVPATGGIPTPVPTVGVDSRWPQFLPDGRHFLYHGCCGDSGLYVGDVESASEPLAAALTATGAGGMYAAAGDSSGFLVFMSQSTLMAQRFDPERHTMIGDPRPIAELDEGDPVSGRRPPFSVSSNGVLVYRGASGPQTAQFAWFDRAGNQTGTTVPTDQLSHPALAPDAADVAWDQLDVRSQNRDVWVLNLARDRKARLATDSEFPVWSSNGQALFLSSNRDGTYRIFRTMASGGGKDEAIVHSPTWIVPNSLLEDRLLLYSDRDAKTGWDLWIVPLAGDRKPEPFLRASADEQHGQFSPDGRWIAYTSNETGRQEVYVQAHPASGGKWPISNAGGSMPRWRRDGKELFYLARDGNLMAVDVSSGASFDAGRARALFQTFKTGTNLGITYDVTADGARFFINSGLRSGTDSSPVNVIVNWTAGL